MLEPSYKSVLLARDVTRYRFITCMLNISPNRKVISFGNEEQIISFVLLNKNKIKNLELSRAYTDIFHS